MNSKIKIFSTLLVFVLLSVVLIISCKKKDKCDGITCDLGYTCIDGDCILTDPCAECNHGTCVDDTCQCDYSWEGQKCDVEKRIKYYGTFNCVRDTVHFVSTISSSPLGLTVVMVNNFGGFTPSINVPMNMTLYGSWACPFNTTYGNITIVGGNGGVPSENSMGLSFTYKVNGGADINSGISFQRQ